MRKVGKKAPRPFDRLAKAAVEQSSTGGSLIISPKRCIIFVASGGGGEGDNIFSSLSKNRGTFKWAMLDGVSTF